MRSAPRYIRLHAVPVRFRNRPGPSGEEQSDRWGIRLPRAAELAESVVAEGKIQYPGPGDGHTGLESFLWEHGADGADRRTDLAATSPQSGAVFLSISCIFTSHSIFSRCAVLSLAWNCSEMENQVNLSTCWKIANHDANKSQRTSQTCESALGPETNLRN